MLLLAACARNQGTAAPGPLDLRQLAELPLPGGASRWDYQSLDPTTDRLYLAHLGADSVVVVDIASQQVVGAVADVAGVHGVLAVPQRGRVYATAADADQLVAIDMQTLRVVGRTAGGHYPDGLAYDPDDDALFVSDELGGTVSVFSATSAEHLATIALGGEVGNTQYDPVAKQILSAGQGRDELVAIDPVARRIARRVALPGCQHAHGLAVDASQRLAFVACDANATLLTVDLRGMQVTGSQTVGDQPDVLAWDAGIGRLYVAAESGTLAVFAERGAALTKVAQAFLAPRAHTVAVDPRTHRLYVPLENSGGQPTLRILAPTGSARRTPAAHDWVSTMYR